MARQSHSSKQSAEQEAAEAEAERVRGMLRDDGVEDPYVTVVGAADRAPRVYVILEDLNMTAVDLLRHPNYSLMGVGEGEVTLTRNFTE
jgi:hypothetical protein